ncbi:MAG: hypothetical protein IJA30_02230 [Bacilli bacterium]|nr:hypothetical protein [Bacilli bacterium]
MGLFNKIFGIFKQKEVVNEETVTEKVISNNEENPIVVSDTTNTPVMVRADDFQDSSVTPEEYKVADDDEIIEEAKVEETVDHGIDVSEGDDMTPIIMDVEETTEVVEEVIEPAEEIVEETLEVVDDVPELIENVEDNTEVIEEVESIETDEEVEVIGSEETLEEEIEVL